MPAIGSAVASFVFALGASGATAVAIGTFAAKLVIGTAITLVGQLFADKPKGVKPRGIQTEQTTTGDVTPQKFVVGTYALEGHASAPSYSYRTKNKTLLYVLEISDIPIEGLTDRVVIDGEYSTYTSNETSENAVTSAEKDADTKFLVGLRKDNYERGWFNFYDGTQTTASPRLTGPFSNHPDRPWTSDHKLQGVAYAVMQFFFDPEIFSGFPSVRFEVKGIRLYDPRKDTSVGGSGAHRWGTPSTYEWTDNPQVISYNVLRGITLPNGDVYGGEVPAEDLPLDNWFSAMNECDVMIGDRKQFTAGFEINTNEMEPFEVIKEMNRASFAQISEFGGVFRVRVGAPAAPVMHLTDDDFVVTEASRFVPFPGLADTSNAITGTYLEPVDVWQSRSAEAITRPEWEAADGNRRLTLNMDMPAVSNGSQAKHLLNAYLEDSRRFRTHQMGLPPSFALLEPLDVISWTSEANGYAEKLFEIVEVEDRADTAVQIVKVREREPGDVFWEAALDVPQPVAYNQYTAPPRPQVSIPSEGIRAFTQVVREAVSNVIEITVKSATGDDEFRVQVQYLKVGTDEWISLGAGPPGPYQLQDPDIGTYRFRARTFLRDSAIPGPWVVSTDVDTTGSLGAPDTVTGFFAEINDGTTTLEWEPVLNQDLSYYRIRHAVETAGATWANATTAIDKVPRPGSSVSLPTRPGTYMIRAVDKTGLSSFDITALVVPVEDAPEFAQRLTAAEHSGFTGSKTGLTVNVDRLEITDPSSAPSEGTYDFAGHIETHDSTVRRARVRVDAATLRLDESAGTFDDMPGTWDDAPGLFDDGGSDAQFADTDIQFFVSTTADDPSGTPTWTDYRRFRSGEFSGRGFRFRAILKSVSNNVTPSVGALTAIVEYDT